MGLKDLVLECAANGAPIVGVTSPVSPTAIAVMTTTSNAVRSVEDTHAMNGSTETPRRIAVSS